MALWLGLVAVGAVGALQVVSSAINAAAGRELGILRATFVFLGIGAVLAIALSYLFETGLSRTHLAEVPAYLYIPGLINILFIAVQIRLVNYLGAMLTQASVFSGQMVTSLFLDHVGFAGLPVVAATVGRTVSVIILLFGVGLLASATRIGSGSLTLGRMDSDKSARSGGPSSKAIQYVPPIADTAVKALGPAEVVAPSPTTVQLVGRANVHAAAIGLVLGAMISTAMALNAILGQYAGPFTSTALFLAPGALFLLLYFIVKERPGKQGRTSTPWSWLYLVPGTLNVVGVTGSIVLIPLVGVQLMTGTGFAVGVLTALVLVDRLGLFGLPRNAPNLRRVVAAIVLVLGVFVSTLAVAK